MLINKSQNTVNPLTRRISEIATDLNNSANQWNDVDSSIATADRYLGNSYREFERAEFPLRQVQWDNERTDSSWHGRDLDRQFRSGGREADSAGWEVRRADAKLEDIKTGVAQGGQGLQEIVDEMRQTNDPRLPIILEAAQAVSQSGQAFQRVDRDLNSVDSDGRFLDSAAFRAQNPIYQISNDRPGVNVSRYAFPVSNALQDIGRNLQSMDRSLQDADVQGDQGQAKLLEAVQTLILVSQGN